MKRFFFTILFLLFALLTQAKGISWESEFDIDLTYNSNILNYSENDRDAFENNINPEKFLIESLDDMIMGFKYNLKSRYYSFDGHTQIINLGINYKKYLNNEIKDDINVQAGIKQYFSPKLITSLSYSFYPEIYLRQYKSVIDNEYHNYEYAKNGYSAELEWKALKNLDLRLNADYSQLYFNEWFTEYDADVITANCYLIWKLNPRLTTEFRYAFRIATADAEEAYQPASVSVIKDGSFDGNIIGVKLKFRRFLADYTLNLGYRLEDKFYSSGFEGDDYHIERDDYIHTGSMSIYVPLAKNLNMVLHAEYEERETRSPFTNVIRDKEYNTWNSGISFAYDLKHR
ncbi:MAG: hypothetical protein K9N06_06410 [Candidatus Cloacimonetes bacterium]|nr:hypothetical protein [Candidatus Cloacimonadota bacterium]